MNSDLQQREYLPLHNLMTWAFHVWQPSQAKISGNQINLSGPKMRTRFCSSMYEVVDIGYVDIWMNTNLTEQHLVSRREMLRCGYHGSLWSRWRRCSFGCLCISTIEAK